MNILALLFSVWKPVRHRVLLCGAILALSFALSSFASFTYTSDFTIGLTDYIKTESAPAFYSAEGNPARLFVTDRFVFVLEQFNHRIAVYNRATKALCFYFGATEKNGLGVQYTDGTLAKTSNALGGMNRPFGLAFDASAGVNRFAVADTANKRIQLFSFHPSTGVITAVAATGATFVNPTSLTFSDDGAMLLVADAGAKCVYQLNGATLAVVATYSFNDEFFTGICYDRAETDGFWAADTKNKRIAYYNLARLATSTAPIVADEEHFVVPRDVQIMTIDGVRYLAVADYEMSTVRIMRPVGADGADYTSIDHVMDVGSASNLELEPIQRVWHPNGVFPVAGENSLYVADYGHNMVKWYGLSIEAEWVDDGPPEEILGETPWDFSSILVIENGESLSLEWGVPTERCPSDGSPLLFRIEYAFQLTGGSWAELDVCSVEQQSSTGNQVIDLTQPPLVGKKTVFFRLTWINQVQNSVQQ